MTPDREALTARLEDAAEHAPFVTKHVAELLRQAAALLRADARKDAVAQPVEAGVTEKAKMPNPTEADLADPMFNAIWEATKTWDINVPEHYVGYCGMNGSHVMLILNALRPLDRGVEEGTDSIGDWQCRDYADGWITFPTRKAAEKYQQQTGTLMRYRRYYPAAIDAERKGAV